MDYEKIYLYVMFVIVIAVIMRLLMQQGRADIPAFSKGLAVFTVVFMVFYLTFYPIPLYSDKYSYMMRFLRTGTAEASATRDVGFGIYTSIVKRITSNPIIYFLITASLYVFGYVRFGRRVFGKTHLSLYLVATFISFGFVSYGVNTLRAGLALSLLMLALSYYRQFWWFVLFGALAISMHKSMAVPFGFFYLTKYWNNPIKIRRLWFFALLLSAVNIGPVSAFLQENVFGFDDRADIYFEAERPNYNVGFRVDFIIFSLIPMLVGWYYVNRLRLRDVFYARILNTYVLTNALWLLVIRIAFTDRLAYLSWFLIPVIILYPLIKYPLPINRVRWLVITLLLTFMFTSYML